jgi:hypothetical protein
MPAVLSKQLFYVSRIVGLQAQMGTAPAKMPDGGGNYHFWLEEKSTGKIFDRTPTHPDQPPLTIKGKVDRHYAKFDDIKTKTLLKDLIGNLVRNGLDADYLRRYYVNPECLRCFQNTYSFYIHEEGAKDRYHMRAGALGYLTDHPEIIANCNRGHADRRGQLAMKKVISLDFGF